MQYDKQIQAGPYWLSIDTEAQYGYFEHDDYGEDDGGSFEMEHDVVTDMDGCYVIPRTVAKAIQDFGFTIDQEEFCA